MAIQSLHFFMKLKCFNSTPHANDFQIDPFLEPFAAQKHESRENEPKYFEIEHIKFTQHCYYIAVPNSRKNELKNYGWSLKIRFAQEYVVQHDGAVLLACLVFGMTLFNPPSPSPPFVSLPRFVAGAKRRITYILYTHYFRVVVVLFIFILLFFCLAFCIGCNSPLKFMERKEKHIQGQGGYILDEREMLVTRFHSMQIMPVHM